MVQSLAITKAITSIAQLRERFNLTPADNDQFFIEWHQGLPELTEQEKATLDKLKHRFSRHRDQGKLAEGTVKLLLISPLLELAGFYDDPFYVTTEPLVEILIEDRDELLRGRIDALVIQDRLWVLVVESKRTVNFTAAIPQALAYLLGNPYPEKPVYSMVTDGDLFMFIKLLKQDIPIYDFSETFSLLLLRRNKLYDILRVLKQIGNLIR